MTAQLGIWKIVTVPNPDPTKSHLPLFQITRNGEPVGQPEQFKGNANDRAYKLITNEAKSSMTFVTEPKDDGSGGWSRKVKVGDNEYSCTISRGKSVRIPYKPKGQNRGYKWQGAVWVLGPGARRLWIDEVPKSTGCVGLLNAAGVFEQEALKQKEIQA